MTRAKRDQIISLAFKHKIKSVIPVQIKYQLERPFLIIFEPMIKRIFDVVFALVGILLFPPIIFVCWLFACLDTQSNGLFLQSRIGQYGKPFTIYKFKTFHRKTNNISAIGAFFRKFKLDELPQLLNVLQGSMSMVGPRPDIAGYYDVLKGENSKILELKPGLTSEAAIKYANEENLLATIVNPQQYNDKVIFPDKVKLNLEYYYNRSFWGDLKIIWQTFLRIFK